MLEAHGVTVRFGGHVALHDASIAAPAGVVTGLIGPNGAGKTTLFNAITGLVSPASGRILIGGEDVTGMSLHRRARHGVARTFQQLELFTMLTVRENIRVAADIRKRWARDGSDTARITEEVIDRVGLRPFADERVTSLPTGLGRLVELGRAMSCQPRVLLLDEPASGQDDTETARFGQLLVELAEDGTAVLLVEHDMSLVMDVCHTVHVLDLGQMLSVGTPAEVQNDPLVADAYLGTGGGGDV